MVGMTLELDFCSAIGQMLNPYALTTIRSPFITVHQGLGGGQTVEIEAMLKPVDLPEQPTSRQTRTALLESANRAINAFEAFGFRQSEAPKIEFGGQVAHRYSEDPLIVTECWLRLTMLPPKD